MKRLLLLSLAYQWLIYAQLHTMRHDKQIAEVKATAGYPSND